MSQFLLTLVFILSVACAQAATVSIDLNGVRYPMAANGFQYQGPGQLTLKTSTPVVCNFAPVQSPNFILNFNGYQTNYNPASFSYDDLGRRDFVATVNTSTAGSCFVVDSIFNIGFEN